MLGTAGPQLTALLEVGGEGRAVAEGEEVAATELHLYNQSRSLTALSATPGRISVQRLMTTFSFHSTSKKQATCVRIWPITAKYLYPLKNKITPVTHKHSLHMGALSYPNIG